MGESEGPTGCKPVGPSRFCAIYILLQFKHHAIDI